MAGPIQNPAEPLCEEIIAAARRAADEALRAAQAQAAEILSKAAADAEREREEKLSQARSAAARRSDLILATVPVEVARMKAARIELLLGAVLDDVRQQLAVRDRTNEREVAIALATEALKRMSGDEFVLKVSARPDDAALDEIKRRVGRAELRIRIEESAEVGAGVIVLDVEDRQIWDNRLVARLDRMWPEIRRQIALQTKLVLGGAK